MSRRSRDLADLTVLRYVPGDSVVHRAGALAKILVLVAMTIALAARASWPAIATAGGLAVVGFVAAGLPLGVLPRPPRLLWWGLGLSATLAVIAGGEPEIVVAGTSFEVGGLEAFLRFFALTIVVLGTAGLVGWTTPAADLTPAIAAILRPLRPLRVPVDELVSALALSVRVLPLLIDEMRTVALVLRTREPKDDRKLSSLVLDVMATVVATSVRRAVELGDALMTRGGSRVPASSTPFGVLDGLIVVLGVGLAVVMVVAG
ncbi:MAG: energy-coupling factor transporter transmembrane protein EcfT [Actinomycetota bacterium]